MAQQTRLRPELAAEALRFLQKTVHCSSMAKLQNWAPVVGSRFLKTQSLVPMAPRSGDWGHLLVYLIRSAELRESA